MNTFTKLPEFPFFVVHRGERWCVYTVTQNTQREDKVSLRWFENSKYLVADYYTKIDILGYLNSGMWLLCDSDGNIIENYTEEKEMMTVQKKLKPSDVRNYVRGKHQPYTDYNKEIEDWLVNNSDDTDFYNWKDGEFIFTGDSTFYRESIVYDDEVYYTNEEFKKLIGMDDTPEKSDAFPTLEAGKHIVQIEGRKWGYYLANDIIAWVTYDNNSAGLGWDKFTNVKDEITHVYEVEAERFPHVKYVTCIWDGTKSKKANIRKELEFAEAKKVRLEKHIDVLKSKLQ